MDSSPVCGTIVPASDSNPVCLGGVHVDDISDDYEALLQAFSAPCSLQLHHYSGLVLNQVAMIGNGRPLLVLFWDDRSQGSIRMFEEILELCELANSKTAIWPVRRKSKDNEFLENALVLRQSTESPLALLITKVGSMFKVLFNLTTRDNLNDTAVVDQFKSALEEFSIRHANWKISENNRLLKEQQEREFMESLIADQEDSHSQMALTTCEQQETDESGLISTVLSSTPSISQSNENKDSHSQMALTTCEQQETGESGLSSTVLSSTPSISQSNESKEVYDWLGSMEQLPLFFSLHRPLGGAAIQHQEVVVQSEKVFVHELTSREARETFNDSVSLFGNFQLETEGNKTLPDEQEAGTEETKKEETNPGGAEKCRKRGKGSKNKKNKQPRLTEDNE